jgi:hypothetical protein
MSNDDTALVTIDGAVMLIRERLGIPIPKSRLHKDSATGIAPKPDAVYGRRYLWKPEKILAYAQTLIKPCPPEAASRTVAARVAKRDAVS